jgi:succinoglycan biosynthesis protein ExoA
MVSISSEHPETIDQVTARSETSTTPRPIVSAIVAVRNEASHIESVVKSLLRQDTTDFDLELIIVDGESSDATQCITQRMSDADRRVKLIINRDKKTPYAFNLGLQAASGEYVCIMGAHSVYARDYITTCLKELKRNGAAGCSGREWVRANGTGLQARLAAWALAHPFGTSSGSMRTRGAGFADSIPYPVFLKSVLIDVGGYNTQLHRNQDNDICQKLRARGHTLYMTDKTSCDYFVSPDLPSLSRYAFRTGFWNFISLKVNPSSMAIRHFVPAGFVAVALLSLLAFVFSFSGMSHGQLVLRSSFLLLALAYGIASFGAACHIAFTRKSVDALLVPLGFLVLHFSYGIGTLTAILMNAHAPTREMSRI